MPPTLDKVTAFITRNTAGGKQLLLIRHPFAGYQFPAGTVEEGEAFEAAVLREAYEETGLIHISMISQLGELFEEYPDHAFTLRKVTVYARPDITSFDWAYLPRGAGVDLLRQYNGYAHVSFVEGDVYPDPSYITYQITGWVPEDCLGTQLHRRIYHLICQQDTPDTWQVHVDQHTYTLVWMDIDHLPEIVYPQNTYWQQFGKQLSVKI
jgi:8-oxo-dGTP pyrophosphatase MutT (NUDIX family)